VIHLLSRLAAVVLAFPRSIKRGVALCIDAVLCVLAVWLAFYLRLGAFSSLFGPPLVPIFISIVMALPLFIVSGLYRAIFRYSGMPAMTVIVRAMLLYGLVFAAIFTFYGIEGVPRTVGLIQPLLLLLLVGGSRVAVRIWLGGLYHQQLRKAALPQVLIYGAGSAGRQLASAMVSSQEMLVNGFLDDDKRLHGQVLNGLPIYSPLDLAKVLAKDPITDVLLALPSVNRQRRNEILSLLSQHKIAVRTLPGISDIAFGKVSLSDVHDLDINDLLGREPVVPNHILFTKNIVNKVVLVTGAGGSIGSELCRQILTLGPANLLLIEQSEFALYAIHQDLEAKQPHKKNVLVPLLGSVQDVDRMIEIISTWAPDTIYHAAAYKHVPLVEHNPAEGITNNVLGTLRIAQVAVANGVKDFVLISTDKAVRPTNVMGASKRLAEMVLQALALEISKLGGRTCLCMVRFGNVLGSSGSVVPLFRQQIKDSGPITLTDERITRYFMTIPEAAQLVIQAGAMARGGDVFVLDMGEPVKIADLARRMVELSGLTIRDEANPNGDIEIQVTGLRPGEKLYEELLIGDNPLPTSHSRIMKAHEDFLLWSELQAKLDGLTHALDANDVPLIRNLLKDLVPGYQPEGGVVDWVWMARKNKNKVNFD
jgi:FlaA1/EpsC-like NDP-sugar epimerase